MTTLTAQLKNLFSDADFEYPSDRIEAIDELRIQAGAALHKAHHMLSDAASKIALRHVCDVDDVSKELEDASELLREGGDMTAFFDEVDAGNVDQDSLPGMLNGYFGPLAAYDPAQQELQAQQAQAAARALTEAQNLINMIPRLRINDMDTASELLFAAANRCEATPQINMQSVLMKTA